MEVFVVFKGEFEVVPRLIHNSNYARCTQNLIAHRKDLSQLFIYFILQKLWPFKNFNSAPLYECIVFQVTISIADIIILAYMRLPSSVGVVDSILV